jgi:hypothetical protein
MVAWGVAAFSQCRVECNNKKCISIARMLPPERFTFRALPLVATTDKSAKLENVPRDESNELEALINGDFSTVAQVHPRLRFQAIGSCPVPLRASVMRVCKSLSNPR